MHIFLVNGLFPPLGIGGSEESTLQLSQGLRLLGHRVTVLSRNVDPETVREERDGVTIVRFGSHPGSGPNVFDETHYTRAAQAQIPLVGDRQPAFDDQVMSEITRARPQIIHTNVAPKLPQMWKKARKAGIPVIHTLRSYTLLCHRRMVFQGSPCAWRCSRCEKIKPGARVESFNVDAVVGISQHVLRVHLAAGYFQGAIDTVIPNSYDVAEGFIKQEKPEFTFGFIGRLHHTKGVEEFLEAASLLSDEKKFTVAIAGTGNAEYESYLKERYSSDRVIFLGYTSKEEFFARIKYCIVPSVWYEPFGRVFAESLCFGTPVLGSIRGGGAEIVRHERDGLLFEPTVEDIRQTLERALRLTNEEYKEYCINAISRRDEFSNKAIASAYVKLYDRVLWGL